MKVFRNKLTGRLGETQFGEDSAVLIRNAKSAGFKDNEIEIIDMTAKDYRDAIVLQNYDDLSPTGKRELQIRQKEQEILRRMAIKELDG